MKSNSTMKKHIGKTDPGDRFSCALCGDRQIHSGIIFKGHCICGKCVAYIYSGTLAGDGKKEVMTFEPGQIRSFRTPAAEIPDGGILGRRIKRPLRSRNRTRQTGRPG